MTTIPTVRGTATKSSDPLLDVLFPEASMVQNMKATNALLQQLVSNLHGVSSQVTTGDQALAAMVPAFRAPDTVLDVLMAAQQRGYVEGVLARLAFTVYAGQNVSLTLPTPTNEVGFVVAEDRMDVSPHSVDLTVTGGEDTNYPTLVNVPMESSLRVTGSLYYPVSFQFTRKIGADPWRDIRYTETVSLVLVNATFYSDRLQPYLTRLMGGL